MDRKQALARLWRETHRDYKGSANGVRSVMVFRPSVGSCIVALDDLTEAEIADRVIGYAKAASNG